MRPSLRPPARLQVSRSPSRASTGAQHGLRSAPPRSVSRTTDSEFWKHCRSDLLLSALDTLTAPLLTGNSELLSVAHVATVALLGDLPLHPRHFATTGQPGGAEPAQRRGQSPEKHGEPLPHPPSSALSSGPVQSVYHLRWVDPGSP